LPQYSIRGVFFSEHPVTLTFGLDRHQATETAAFAQIAEVDSKSEQAGLQFKNETLPDRGLRLQRSHHGDPARPRGEPDETIRTYGFNVGHLLDPRRRTLTYEDTDETENIVDTSNIPGTVTHYSSRRKARDLTLPTCSSSTPPATTTWTRA